MALSVGEIEATLKLKDELTAKLKEVKAKLKDVDTTVQGTQKNTTGLSSAFSAVGPAIAGAFSVAAVINFTKELLRTADALTRMSDRTGMTATEVQRMSFAAAQSGNSIEELVSAIGQMQNRLSSGDASAVQGVKDLHLSMTRLMASNPSDQMAMLAEGIGKIEDPARRAQIAMDLFGKSGVAILPTLISDYRKLADAAPTMSNAQIKALDTVGDAIDEYALRVKVGLAQGVMAWIGYSASMQQAIADAEQAQATLDKLAKGAPKFNAALTALPPIVANVERETTALTASLEKNKKAHEEAQQAMRETAETLADMRRSVIAATVPLKYQTVELITLEKAWEGYASQTLRSISDIEAVQQPLSAMEINLKAANAQLLMMPTVVSSLAPAFDQLGFRIDATTAKVLTLRQTFRGALDGVDSILTSIGGKFAEVTSMVVRTGKAVMDNLASGNIWGAVVSGVTGVIGVFKKLFTGISKEVEEARRGVAEFQALFGGYSPMVQAVIDAYLKLGRTGEEAHEILRKLWNTDDPKASAEALREINVVLADQIKLLRDAEAAAVWLTANTDILERHGRGREGNESGAGMSHGGVVHAARGGVVQYAAAGARILPFPGSGRGTDTVPAWLTPGEGVVTRAGMQALGADGLGAINHGGASGVDVSSVTQELRALRADQARRDALFTTQLARAVRDEVQKVSRR